MSKLLTLSVCLALALASTSGVALAGGHGGLMPSPQVVAAPQHVAPSGQGVLPTAQGYGDVCAPAPKHCGLKLPHISLPKICLPKIELPKIPPKCYEYEWVLKKKRVGGGLLGMLHHNKGCAPEVVDYGHAVYPTGQGLVTPTAQYTGAVYGTGQAYGSGQAAPAAPGMMEPAPAEETDIAPEAPVVPSAYGRLGSSLFGTTR
ncbi:hypothetical protein [Tautonia rosea]|uniref:hypothetical protein n=1 Tax=Tautonia rosea TaxID=2728037 RepID=UPI001472F355|nr:hypothetical protein [Tautonia rosea]